MKLASWLPALTVLVSCQSTEMTSVFDYVVNEPDFSRKENIENIVKIECPQDVVVLLKDIEPINLGSKMLLGFEVDVIEAFGGEYALEVTPLENDSRVFQGLFSIRCAVGGNKYRVQMVLRQGTGDEFDLLLVDIQPSGANTLDGADYRFEDFD